MSIKRFAQRAIEGERGLAAAAYRAVACLAAPAYGLGVEIRNRAFDRHPGKSTPLGRPTISIGNLSVGGTGKTPVTLWLCQQLLDRGHRPAVLMRGYGDDEHRLITECLPSVTVAANPDRVTGARELLARDPSVDVLILDDGFQHRQAAREFDLVLISATQMGGQARLLPRGLWREPLRALRRAHGIVITKSDLVPSTALAAMEHQIMQASPQLPVFRAVHTIPTIIDAESAVHPAQEWLKQRFFAFAGIGDPTGLDTMLQKFFGDYAGHVWYPDHYTYTSTDMHSLLARAERTGSTLVTTEKDWVKVRAVLPSGGKVARFQLVLNFTDEKRLLDLILSRLWPNQPSETL